MDAARLARKWFSQLKWPFATDHAPAVRPVGGRGVPVRPIIVAAFEGWNDAGEAASSAAAYLARSWGAEPFAEISSEEFFDFTEVRPQIAIDDSGERKISWPTTSLVLASGEGRGRDVIILSGPEPQLKWRTYCEAVVALAASLEADRVICLGGYLAEILHNRPVPLSVASNDPRVGDDGLNPSLYEGPTGIVGVLGAALAAEGIASTSLWASVPCYSFPVSAKATLALVRAASRLIGRPVDLAELEAESVDYERRMDEVIHDDENVAAYVARIGEMEELSSQEFSPGTLTEEIERFLRGNR